MISLTPSPNVAQTQEPASHTGGGYWPVLAAAGVCIVVVAAIIWSLAHPFGIHWDEAEYLNYAQLDAQRLRAGALLTVGGRILVKSWGRPPAFRLIALPFIALFGLHTLTARLVSLSCFCLSARFIYLAARSGARASLFASSLAVLLFCLSPEVISASIFFGTDAPLYAAVSALFYYMFRAWTDESKLGHSWVGLGLSLGIGFLAKTSFFAIAIPLLLFWLIAGKYYGGEVSSLLSQWKAGLLALCLAGPWWILNFRSSLAYAQYARGFVRNSLGTPSLSTWGKWVNTVFQSLLGYGVAILIGLVLCAYLRTLAVQKRPMIGRFQLLVLGACASAGLPLVLLQLSGTNHLLRHITPSLIPLAIATAVIADAVEWGKSSASLVTSCALLSGQCAMIVTPVLFPNRTPVEIAFVNGALPWQVMIRYDQWDWTKLLNVSRGCNIRDPRITYLGNGRAFNEPQIKHPWVVTGASAPDVRWLWRYEDGPVDWQKVMDATDESDLVITAPHYGGEARFKEDLDNEHNAEFVERLSGDSNFRAPIHLAMGRFEPVDVLVFTKRSANCDLDKAANGGLQ